MKFEHTFQKILIRAMSIQGISIRKNVRDFIFKIYVIKLLS